MLGKLAKVVNNRAMANLEVKYVAVFLGKSMKLHRGILQIVLLLDFLKSFRLMQFFLFGNSFDGIYPRYCEMFTSLCFR